MSGIGSLDESLARLVGLPAEPGATARDAVNAAMIRHWCDAMGDTNVAYRDDQAAQALGHPGLVAPPTMLQAWTMRGLDATPAPRTAATQALELLDAAGFTSVVATDCVQTYDRYLLVGDRIEERVTVESISSQKSTTLGVGHFVTTRRDYHDQTGSRIGTMQFRLLKFRPTAKSDPGNRPQPLTTMDTEFAVDALGEGRLVAQRCVDCGLVRHPPAPSCPDCGDVSADILELDPRGSVYSYVVVHHPRHEGFDYPLAIALVELEHGVRVIGDVQGVAAAAVHIGMPVQLHRNGSGQHLPHFRPQDG